MWHKIVDTVNILGLQNFDDYGRLNLVEITINSNKIIITLSSYTKYKFRFVIKSLLFSTNLQNNTDVIFITRDSLIEAKTAPITSKLYKTLGVVYLSKIEDWDLIENDSKVMQAVRSPQKNVSDLFKFKITLLDRSDDVITFPSDETEVPTLSFKVQIVK